MPFSSEEMRLFDACYAKALSTGESEGTKLVAMMHDMVDLLHRSQQPFVVRAPPKESLRWASAR